jgi:hypothetical protein
MNTPGLNVNSDCTPWYVDVSCPPYSVRPSPVMTPAEQRERIQQAWDDVSAAGGGVVILPEMYTVDRKPKTFYCLRAKDNVAVWGVNQFASGLRMVHDDPDNIQNHYRNSALMLVATGSVHSSNGGVSEPAGALNVSFARLTLDGDKTGFRPSSSHAEIPQRHCLWLEAAVNVLCDQVRFLNPLMDGAYHYTDTHEVTFRDCLFTGCGRDGIAMTKAAHNVKISRCRFRDIAAQQIDSEPKNTVDVPYDIVVEGCTFEPATGPGKVVVSVEGAGAAKQTHHWRFIGNRFEGPVVVTWGRNIVFSGNEWVIPDETSTNPCLFLKRKTEHVTITGNTFESTIDCILFEAPWEDPTLPSDLQQPRYISIDGNTFLLLQRTAQPAERIVVNAEAGPGEYVFSNNMVLGSSDGTVVALHHRATRTNKGVIICGNIVRQCKVGFKLLFGGRAYPEETPSPLPLNRFERVVLEGNTFDPGSLPASFALILDQNAVFPDPNDPETDPAKKKKVKVIEDFVMAGNIWTGVGLVPVACLKKKPGEEARLVPYDGIQIWHTDGNAGIQSTYSCCDSPLGQFDAPIGSLAVRRNGGTGATFYVKEADTMAGWIAK